MPDGEGVAGGGLEMVRGGLDRGGGIIVKEDAGRLDCWDPAEGRPGRRGF